MSDFAPIDAPGPQAAEPDDPRRGDLAKGDLTKGPILRTLVVFAIPALISNIVQTVNGSINTVWVGRLLGENALAATANANIIMFLTFGTVFGFGMATTVLVGQKFGARDILGARQAFGGGVGFCTGLATVIAALGWIFAPQLLQILSTPPPARPFALSYLRVIFVSMPFGVLSMMVSMGLRGAGDATTPLRATILTVVLDVIFNPPLILGIGPFPKLGIAGSALSSALASAIGSAVMIWRIYPRRARRRLRIGRRGSRRGKSCRASPGLAPPPPAGELRRPRQPSPIRRVSLRQPPRMRIALACRPRAALTCRCAGVLARAQHQTVRGRDRHVIKAEEHTQAHSAAAWPAMAMDEAQALLCAADAPFAIETVTIRGLATRTWKNAIPTLAALAAAGRAYGDSTFLVYEDERVSYDAWHRAVAALAAHLRASGVAKGDRVALAMRNLPEWPVVFFAATAIGAICVPLNAWWTGAELAYGIANSGAKVLICDDERLARIAPHRAALTELEQILVSRCKAAPADCTALEAVIGLPSSYADLPDRDLPETDLTPDDDGTIFYTSGTTGNPKGALGTHRNLLTNIMSSAYHGARSFLRRGEAPPEPTPKVLLVVIPLFHVTACSAMLMGAVAGGHRLVFMHKWDTLKAFAIIEREKVNVTGGVPTIAWQLLEHPDRGQYDLTSLESVSYGGAPSAPELVRKIRDEFGAMPGNGWGMTETMATVTGITAEDYLARPTSAGPAVPVADLRIMDEDGVDERPTGEVGELWARGPMVVKGYWNNPEATAATFIDGWVRTGDLARLDEDRFCYIVDRAKDMLIRGGENIYSSEVENALYDHPAVTDAAVIGIPHRTLGEEPAAVVHLAPGYSASEAELQDWVRAKIAAFKVPVRIVFMAETLPRNANGKILKKELGPLFEEPV